MLSLSLIAAAASLTSTDEAVFTAQAAANLQEKFSNFMDRFDKSYSGEEKALKFVNFIENMIRMGHQAAADPSAKYSHMTPFMDWSEAEFKARNTLKGEDMEQLMSGLQSVHDELDTTDLPSSWDWREHGAVQAIKDQAQCGSCWAFSSVSNIESAAFVQGGQPLRSLSEEQLVDCSQSDNGCNGGLQMRAYMDMTKGDWGLELEKDYPYTAGHGQAGTCKKESSKEVQKISSFKSVSKNPLIAKFTSGTSDETIMAGLIKYGPLAVALDATPMMMYSGGIARNPKCSKQIDHAVNLVGYGTEDNVDYWIVRNSWGTVWGEEGYWRVERGNDNCAINDYVVTAIVDKESIIV